MLHCQQRALERYGKELDEKALHQIKNSIKNKEYLYVGQSQKDEDKTFIYVKYNNIPYKVLFIDEVDPKIITIYPIDVDEYNNLVEQKKIDKYIQYLESKGYKVVKDGES